MEGEEILFRKIDSPVESRRNLLGASKDIIHSLQRYEKLKAIRVKKAERILKLKALVMSISGLTGRLRKEFPDIIFKSKQAPKKEADKKKKDEKKQDDKKPRMDEKKASREMFDLEKQLKDIEKKLEGMS